MQLHFSGLALKPPVQALMADSGTQCRFFHWLSTEEMSYLFSLAAQYGPSLGTSARQQEELIYLLFELERCCASAHHWLL